MSDPRYEPRRFTSDPAQFGRAGTLSWVTGAEADPAKLVAARLQHEYAWRIRSAACCKYGSLRRYARAADLNYDRLSKVIRGEVLMRLEDIALAALWLQERENSEAELSPIDFVWPIVTTEEEVAHV